MLEEQIFHARPVKMSLQRNSSTRPPWLVSSTLLNSVVWNEEDRASLQGKYHSQNKICMAVLSSGEGSISVETRQMNAGSIILSQDDRIAFIRKVYQTAKGTKYVLDLPAGGPQSADETSLDDVRINEVDREEAILLCNGNMLVTPQCAGEQRKHKKAILDNKGRT